MSLSGRGWRTLRRTNLATSHSPPLHKVAVCISTRSPHAIQPQNSHLRAHRFYSSQNASHEAGPTEQDAQPADEENFDLTLEEEMLAVQNASIAEIESQLGKSLEEAVFKDNLAYRLFGESSQDKSEELEDLDDMQAHGLVLLRFQGASAEEMAREARSVYGDELPRDVLREEELVIYKRLYGAPVFVADPPDVLDGERDVDVDHTPENVLLDADGLEIPYSLENEAEIEQQMDSKRDLASPTQSQEHAVPSMSMSEVFGHNTRAAEVADALDSELVHDFDDLEEDQDEDSEDTRTHPLTSIGRFATQPTTKFFDAATFVRPIEKIMGEFSNKHLKEMCEKTFGGPGLPDSPLTPRSGRSRPQVPIPLGADQTVMGQMEANAFVASVMPPTYASLSAVLIETRKRLGASWLTKLLAKPDGPRILDAGSGGVGIMAWQEIVQAHWDSLHTSDKRTPPPPRSKSVVLTGSETLRNRAATLLENTTFVPRLPDYVNVRQGPTMDDDRPTQARKQFDVIISSHALYPLREEWERKRHLQNLWSLLSDDGGVIILLEKGIPRGFEVVAAARDLLLERYIAVPEGQKSEYANDAETNSRGAEVHQKVPGMIVAPCTTHGRCPLYRTSGISKGRRDICSFQQRYIRPAFLQRIIGAKDRNHDDVDFSYLTVMKGDDLRSRSFSTWDHIRDPSSAPHVTDADAVSSAENQATAASEIQQGFEYYDPTVSDPAPPPPAHTLPRILGAPLKRRGHVTMDLCTPQGHIRRWTVPKSFSRQAYRDARKARWGDLWALGAKTSIPRNLKLGVPVKDLVMGEGLRETGSKPRSRKARLPAQVERALKAEEAEKTEEEVEEEEFMKMLERDNLLDGGEDDGDGLYDMDTGLRQTNRRGPTTGSSTTKSRSPGSSRSLENERTKPAGQQPSYLDLLQSTQLPADKSASQRMGYEDGLSDWAKEFESKALEDEARRRVGKTGRRPTAKNTQRFKRDLRRTNNKQNGDKDLD